MGPKVIMLFFTGRSLSEGTSIVTYEAHIFHGARGLKFNFKKKTIEHCTMYL